MANEAGVTVKAPRICKRQQHRSNKAADSAESHFRVNLSIPFIDQLLDELQTRFSQQNCTAVKGFSIIPSFMIANKDANSNTHANSLDIPSWKADFLEFVEMYREDFPNHNMISSELVIWETLWIDHQTKPVPNNIADTLKIADQLTFPNIYAALTILAVLPVTLCSCELFLHLL